MSAPKREVFLAAPACTVNGAASANGTNVAAGSTVTIQLVDLTSTTWTLSVTGTDEISSPPALSIVQSTKTATFTAGAAGSAYLFTSTTDGGQTSTFTVYVLAASGSRVLAIGEKLEGNSVAGWIATVNPVLRSIGPTPALVGPSVSGALTVQAVAGSGKNIQYTVESDVSTTDATVTTLYSFTPPVSSSVRVYATIVAEKSDGTDDYGVDLVASFRTDGTGIVTARLASTKSNEQTATAAIPTPTIDTSGGLIRVRVTGIAAQTWRWAGATTVVQRTVAA